ncbi:hypothetical protein MNBD_GAMMA07-842 [hydrothermal vent metagenome]|uniref:Uncharacterized protein n=2 Tax=hydrothermal vent metagenome TaxID=652676 RepID=A0A3B0WNN1_9ZZZZ
MKNQSWLTLIIFFLSANAHAFHSKNIEIFEQFDDLKMVAFIDKNDILDNPEWNPDISTPPLTIAEAIKAIKTFNKSSNSIKEIELKLLPNETKHWHYLVKTEDNTAKTKYNIYVVLMNGKVIPAIIEPQT